MITVNCNCKHKTRIRIRIDYATVHDLMVNYPIIYQYDIIDYRTFCINNASQN